MGAEPTEREARRRQGRYYTPAAVVRDMVRRALDGRPAPRRALEPAVGDGRFLAALGLSGAAMTGIDADPTALAAARARLPGGTRLIEGDALAWLAPGREEPGLFDLVLGNPPYGLVPEASQRDWLRRTYRRHRGPFDRYRLFLEACLGRLAPGGRLVLLLPTTWQGLRHAGPLREWIARDFAWRAVVHYDWEIFPEAEVRVAAFVIDRAPGGAPTVVLRVGADGGETEEAPEGGEALLRGLAARHPRLDERFLVSSGLKPYQRGKGQPPQAGHEGRERRFEAAGPEDASCRPLLVGRHVRPYRDRWEADSWLRYGPWLAEPRDAAWFDAPLKIVGRQTGDRLVACLDDERRVARDSTWLVRPRAETPPEELLWLLAVLNDPIATALFRHREPDEVGKVFAQVRVGSVRRLPCPPLATQPPAAQAAALAALRERIVTPTLAQAADCEATLRELVRQAYGLSAEEYRRLGARASSPA